MRDIQLCMNISHQLLGGTMFYHSIEWGFDVDYINKKEDAKAFLNKLGLRCCIDEVCDFDKLNLKFNNNKNISYLVISFNKKNPKNRMGYFDICNYNQLLRHIKIDWGCDFQELEFYFIVQMKHTLNCFTATLFSNGKGDVIIEYLKGVVDNRYVTSGSDNNNNSLFTEKIYMHDYSLVYCEDYSVFTCLYEVIKVCSFFEGYYELSYANVHGEKGIYFSYYSKDKIYQNIFEIDIIGDKLISNRCIMNYLLLQNRIY